MMLIIVIGKDQLKYLHLLTFKVLSDGDEEYDVLLEGELFICEWGLGGSLMWYACGYNW